MWFSVCVAPMCIDGVCGWPQRRADSNSAASCMPHNLAQTAHKYRTKMPCVRSSSSLSPCECVICGCGCVCCFFSFASPQNCSETRKHIHTHKTLRTQTLCVGVSLPSLPSPAAAAAVARIPISTARAVRIPHKRSIHAHSKQPRAQNDSAGGLSSVQPNQTELA